MQISAFELDIAFLGQLRPAGDIGLDKFAERLGRHGARLDRLDRQLFCHVRRLQGQREGVAQSFKHISRQSGRADNAIPLLCVKALKSYL